MKNLIVLIVVALLGETSMAAAAQDNSSQSPTRSSSRSENTMVRDLFGRWERVWHEEGRSRSGMRGSELHPA